MCLWVSWGILGCPGGNKTDLLLVVNVNNIRFSDISAKHFDHQANKQKKKLYTKIPNQQQKICVRG